MRESHPGLPVAKNGDFQQSAGGQMACGVARLFEAFWAAARVCAKSV